MFTAISFVVVAVGSFVVGKIYGARVEAKAIAFVLKEEAKKTAEYRVVIAEIKARGYGLMSRLKSFL